MDNSKLLLSDTGKSRAIEKRQRSSPTSLRRCSVTRPNKSACHSDMPRKIRNRIHIHLRVLVYLPSEDIVLFEKVLKKPATLSSKDISGFRAQGEFHVPAPLSQCSHIGMLHVGTPECCRGKPTTSSPPQIPASVSVLLPLGPASKQLSEPAGRG